MSCSYSIAGALFEPERGALKGQDGAAATLRPKSAEVFQYLADRAGRLVSRDELLEAVWPGVYVTENGLSQCIAEIRRALGPDRGLLRTFPRRGYVLDAALRDEAPPAVGAVERTTPIDRSGVPVLAVLPFRSIPADPILASLADVLLDSLVGALATLREPIVISANSTRHISEPAADVPSLARRFGANYLATGALRRMGERIRLSIEVAEAGLGAVIWHRSHEVTEAMLFQAPEALAPMIAHALAPSVRAMELRNARRRQHDVSAYHLMLQAQSLMFRLEPASFEIAGAMLRDSAMRDPGFAAPHAALGDWLSLRLGQGWSPDRDADTRALEAELNLALELDAGDSRALASLGHNQTILHRRYDAALDLIHRALDASPNDAETSMWAAPTLAFIGRADEAIQNAERAIRLSPEDPLLFRYQHFLSIAYYAKGVFEAAADWGLRSMRNNRDYTSNLRLTVAALAALGRIEEARPLVHRVMQLEPKFRVAPFVARMVYRDDSNRQRYAEHLEAAGLPR